jgi:hypothetical protein
VTVDSAFDSWRAPVRRPAAAVLKTRLAAAQRCIIARTPQRNTMSSARDGRFRCSASAFAPFFWTQFLGAAGDSIFNSPSRCW